MARRKRRTTSKRASNPAPKPTPVPEPWDDERAFVLTVPYEDRSIASSVGARYFPGYGWVYLGAALPQQLAQYRPPPYSWERWVEHELNHTRPAPHAPSNPVTLRPDQREDADLICDIRRHGAPEFMVGSDVGTGKTVTTVQAVLDMPDVQTVLVVAPLVVLAHWRRHLRDMGDGGKRWCLINYESCKKLLEPPPKARTAKKQRTRNLLTARHGTPKVAWDVVITDESHSLGDPESQQTTTMDRVVNGPGGHTPAFAIRLSATAGSDPSQLAYLHRGLAWATGERITGSVSADDYVDWCARHNYAVDRSGYGKALAWERNDTDLGRMHQLIFETTPRWGVRRTPPWGEPPRIPMPITLNAAERAAYETEWRHFDQARRELEKTRDGATTDTSPAAQKARKAAAEKGRAAQIRYRQKAGEIKARPVAEFAAAALAKGQQVAIACEYIGAVDAITEHLERAGVPVAIYTGQNRDTRENDRLAFQRGDKPVIIFTPTDGFNLQAHDRHVEHPSLAPRVTVVAQPRWSPKKALQVEGRCHRDHQTAPVYYVYGENTVEEHIIAKGLVGMLDTKHLLGDDTDDIAAVMSTIKVGT